MVVLLDYVKEGNPGVLKPEEVKEAFESAINVANRALFGKESELRNKVTGQLILGRLRAVQDNPHLNQILIHPEIASEKGNQKDLLIPSQRLRSMVMLHETLHQLFRTLNIWQPPFSLKGVSEHELQVRIWLRYFEHPLSEILPPMELLPDNVAGEINKLVMACGTIGKCARENTSEPGGSFMAPPLVPPVPHGPDINSDGIPDTIGDVIVGYNEGSKEGEGDYLVGLKPNVPILRGPPPNWFGFDLNEYTECPVQKKENIKAWVVRSFDPFDRQHRSFARFYNKYKMSFAPGEKVFFPGATQPQLIQGIVVYIDEKAQMPVAPVYAQFDGCKFVPLDQLALATSQGERLDMNRVAQIMILNSTVKDPSQAENVAANALREIMESRKNSLEVVSSLSKEEEEQHLNFRNELLPHLHQIADSLGTPPTAFENSALTLLRLPLQDYPQPPCGLCCQHRAQNP